MESDYVAVTITPDELLQMDLYITKISGDFSVKFQIRADSEEISGGIPVKQSKIAHFNVFRVNRRNPSVYFGYFQFNFLFKRKFSSYFFKPALAACTSQETPDDFLHPRFFILVN